MQINSIGSMFTVFFAALPITDFEKAKTSDTARYAKFFHAMLEGGVYLPPSQFETCFMSLAHTRNDIKATILARSGSIQRLPAYLSIAVRKASGCY